MSGSSGHAHAQGLKHQFEDLGQQKQASTLGMWAFLLTEVMFFGGLFAGYTVYRFQYPEAFAAASRELDWKLGMINTIVLIGSSLTMVLAVHAAEHGKRQATVLFLALTMILGTVFLVIKGFEYHHKWEHHLVPGLHFARGGAEAGHIQLFFCFYFVMTGMHGLHMVIGFGILLWLAIEASKGKYTPTYYNPVDVAGLYWHFVDIVWIFLFPLLYLIGWHHGS